MNKLDNFTSKLNFKRTAIVLIILAIAGGVLTGFILTKTLKDEFSISSQYHKINEKIDNSRYKSVEDMKNDLSTFANESSDIRDILILDNQNNIIYSAKSSDLSKNGSFNLKSGDTTNPSILNLEEDPNIYFKVIDDNNFSIKDFFKKDKKQVKSEYKEHKFYESMDNNYGTYFLAYEIDDMLGVKVYFISDNVSKFNFAPIMKGFGILFLAFIFYSLLFVIYWITLALYVYELARKSNLNPVIWGLITLCTNLIGLFIFLIYKQNIRFCEFCGYPKFSNTCTHCGNKVVNEMDTCKKCGAEVSKKDLFCSKCGEPTKDVNEKEIIDVSEEKEDNKDI